MKPLSIYLLIDFYLGPVAGTERQLYLLARGLVERGHAVRLFVLRHTAFTRGGEDFPCPIECLDVGSMLSLDTAGKMRSFRRRIQRERPDVVHAFFNDSAILAPLACRTQSTRVLTSRRDMGYWYTPKLLMALAIANRRAARIVCNAHAVAAEVRLRERAREDQLVVIHNACPPAHATPMDEGGEPAKPPSPVPDAIPRAQGEVWVGLVANLRPVKRIEDLLQAAAIARREVAGLRIVVAGAASDRDYAATLRQLAGSLELSNAVHFLPSTNRPLDLMRQCDIGVLTSESEGLSNTLMEYMSCGLPVVCSNVGGNPELVTHGRHGFLYPAGDFRALAGHLVKLASDTGLRREMGAHGVERMAEFSPDRMVDAQVEVYRATA